MNPPKKLTTQQQAEETQEAAAQQLEQQAQGREFPSVEEMLRHDALHTTVPPSIGRRLEKSLGPKGAAAASWWRRWLGGV